MKITFSFDSYFAGIFSAGKAVVDVPTNAAIEDAVTVLIDSNPSYPVKLKAKKLVLNGELRALYMVGKQAVRKDYILAADDQIKIMNTFIGG